MRIRRAPRHPIIMEVHGDLLLARILSAVASSIFRVRAVLLSRQTDGSRMDTKSRFCTKKSPGQVAPAREKKAPQATKTKGEKGENMNNRGNQKDWTTTTRGLDKQTALERKNRREQPGKTGATIQAAHQRQTKRKPAQHCNERRQGRKQHTRRNNTREAWQADSLRKPNCRQPFWHSSERPTKDTKDAMRTENMKGAKRHTKEENKTSSRNTRRQDARGENHTPPKQAKGAKQDTKEETTRQEPHTNKENEGQNAC